MMMNDSTTKKVIFTKRSNVVAFYATTQPTTHPTAQTPTATFLRHNTVRRLVVLLLLVLIIAGHFHFHDPTLHESDKFLRFDQARDHRRFVVVRKSTATGTPK
jgi:hypothetical protein